MLAGGLFGGGGVGEDYAAAPGAGAVGEDEGGGHEGVAAPKIDAGCKAGDLVAGPAALLDVVITIPEEEPVSGGGEGGGA